jgi:ankyrin repeat protein
LWAAGNGHAAVAELLLEKGAELESKDKHFGQTPLSRAAGNGHETVVELLLKKGAELESKDKLYRRTPLSWAAVNGHEAVVKLLLGKGAELESKSNSSLTPLSWSAGNGHPLPRHAYKPKNSFFRVADQIIQNIARKGKSGESKDS